VFETAARGIGKLIEAQAVCGGIDFVDQALVRIPANVTAESGERDRVARSGPAQDWIVG